MLGNIQKHESNVYTLMFIPILLPIVVLHNFIIVNYILLLYNFDNSFIYSV